MGNGSDVRADRWVRGWMRIGLIGLGLPVATAGVAWGADGAAAASGEAWQSGHMASRYRSLLAEPTRAPELRGAGRYEAIQQGEAETPRTKPPETQPAWSQRSWESGPSRPPGKRTRLGHGPGGGASAKANGTGGSRRGSKPPGMRPRTGGRSVSRSGGR